MRRAARRIVEKLRLHGHEAFFAGGWVRDFLLRRKPKDIDIATSALPNEVLRLFPNSRSIGAQFGVIQVVMYGHTYEVATFRSDNTYVDGRHPSSVTFSGPEQDALRRDFTVNGLFYDPVADRLIDYVHGKNDIQQKLIRTIGDPTERFTEDKLRMLRAIRLACSLDFRIVPETSSAIQKLAPLILQVSWERIRDELVKIFTGPAAGSGLDLLHSVGLLEHILPEMEQMRGVPRPHGGPPEEDLFSHSRNIMALLRNPSPILAFGALLHDSSKRPGDSDRLQPPGRSTENEAKIAEGICRRLRMSNEEINRIVDLVRTLDEFYRIKDLRESALKRFLRKPHFAEHLELFRVHCLATGRDLEIYRYCADKLKEYREQIEAAPLISGEDLIAMGYPPGPLFKEILRRVEDLQLEGALKNREEAVAHVKTAFPLTDSRPN